MLIVEAGLGSVNFTPMQLGALIVERQGKRALDSRKSLVRNEAQGFGEVFYSEGP